MRLPAAVESVLALPACVYGVSTLFWCFQGASLTGRIKWWRLWGPRNDVEGVLSFLKAAFGYKVLRLGPHEPHTGKCVFLVNHRSWSDFFVDMYVLGARAVPLSRRMVGIAFPAFTSSLVAVKSILLFNRQAVRDTEVYPEGKRSLRSTSLPLKRGMLRYAFSRRLPVVITAHKEEVLSERARSVHFGRTLVTGCSEVLESSSFEDFDAFMDAVQRLWDETWERTHAAPRKGAYATPLGRGLPELVPSFPAMHYSFATLAKESAALLGWLAVLAAGLRINCKGLAALAAAVPPAGRVAVAGLALYAAASLAAAAWLPPRARRGRGSGGSGAAAEHEPLDAELRKGESEGGASVPIVDHAAFLAQLAARLAQQGKRSWKVPQVAAALQKALDILPAGHALRAHLEQNLEEAAATLLEQLQQTGGKEQREAQQHEVGQKPAKRVKKAAKAPAPPAAPAPVPSGTLLDAGLDEEATAVASAARLDAPRALPLLMARQSPPAQLLSWLLEQVRAAQQAASASEAQTLLTVAAVATSLCASLAGLATTTAEAVALYEPAVGQLNEAAVLLRLDGGSAGGTPGVAAGSAAGECDADVQQLAALAARLVTALHLELGRRRQPGAALWQRWQTASAGVASTAAARANETCAALVSLRLRLNSRTAVALGGAPARRQRDALAAQAAHDMRQLAPYAAAGQLARFAAAAPEEELPSDRSILPLYAALAAQGAFACGWRDLAAAESPGPEQYLPRLLAARKAAAAAQALCEPGEAASILAAAERMPAPAAVVDWLRDQPPSTVATVALAAVQRGPAALSAHLLRECPLASLAALTAAASSSAASAGAGEEAEAAGGGVRPDDELLFFDDKEGDATMFGRNAWGEDASEGEEDLSGLGSSEGEGDEGGSGAAAQEGEGGERSEEEED
eukprot:scaffold6.g2768.t1